MRHYFELIANNAIISMIKGTICRDHFLFLLILMNRFQKRINRMNNSIQFCYNNLWLRCQCIVDEKICFEAQNN